VARRRCRRSSGTGETGSIFDFATHLANSPAITGSRDDATIADFRRSRKRHVRFEDEIQKRTGDLIARRKRKARRVIQALQRVKNCSAGPGDLFIATGSVEQLLEIELRDVSRECGKNKAALAVDPLMRTALTVYRRRVVPEADPKALTRGPHRKRTTWRQEKAPAQPVLGKYPS